MAAQSILSSLNTSFKAMLPHAVGRGSSRSKSRDQQTRSKTVQRVSHRTASSGSDASCASMTSATSSKACSSVTSSRLTTSSTPLAPVNYRKHKMQADNQCAGLWNKPQAMVDVDGTDVTLPLDIYWSLLQGGREAQNRGQHRVEDGGRHLLLNTQQDKKKLTLMAL
mmetsp:Transcript_33286/g.75866  ORF Transcript_33286/g.75866 Transcript_33286/m.75866 type:complete len:167 (-) Transcript_33286:172-672(-)